MIDFIFIFFVPLFLVAASKIAGMPTDECLCIGILITLLLHINGSEGMK